MIFPSATHPDADCSDEQSAFYEDNSSCVFESSRPHYGDAFQNVQLRGIMHISGEAAVAQFLPALARMEYLGESAPALHKSPLTDGGIGRLGATQP